MQLTLYRKCILSNDYTEVFEPTNVALNTYLNTLTKRTFEIENAYITNSGRLNIDIILPSDILDIYSYNYMKIENDNIVRYCFIDSIEIGNGIATIFYTTDLWSTYANTMTIRNSFLSYALEENYNENNTPYSIKLKYLPVDYETNDKLVMTDLEPINNQYYILAQCQKYSLTNGENAQVNSRLNFSCMITNTQNGVVQSKFTEAEIKNILNRVQSGASKEMSGFYFEFDNYTILPCIYFPNMYNSTFVGNGAEYILGNNTDGITIRQFGNTDFTYSKQINANFKNIGIGTLSSMFYIVNNNTPWLLNITTYVNEFDIKIVLNYDGILADITSDFVVNVPFNTINGETAAQRKIAYDNQMKNGIQNIVNGGINFLGSAFNVGSHDLGNSSSSSITKYNYGKGGRRTSTSVTRSYSKGDSVSYVDPDYNGMIGGINQIVDGIWNISIAKTPKYQNTYGAFLLGNKYETALGGIKLFSITPDNETQVNKIINEMGYKVYEIVNNWIFKPVSSTGVKVNCLKFDFVRLYGNFTQDIADALKGILLNGIKIWYTYEVNNV